jgi:hypothetical protein
MSFFCATLFSQKAQVVKPKVLHHRTKDPASKPEMTMEASFYRRYAGLFDWKRYQTK